MSESNLNQAGTYRFGPCLSIFIPTHDRAQFLKILLDSIVCDLTGVQSRVEVVISNNCSNDNTEEVVAGFKGVISNLIYARTSKNIGGENLFVGYEVCRGKYIWTIGDDDWIEAGALKNVLSLIDQGHPIICLNFKQFDYRDKKFTSRSFFGIGNSSFMRPSRAIFALNAGLGFISCIVVKRSLLEHVEEFSDLQIRRNAFGFFYLIVALIYTNNGIFFVSAPMLTQGGGNSLLFNSDLPIQVRAESALEIFVRDAGEIWLKLSGHRLTRTVGIDRFAVYLAREVYLRKWVAPIIFFIRIEDGYIRPFSSMLRRSFPFSPTCLLLSSAASAPPEILRKGLESMRNLRRFIDWWASRSQSE